MWGWLINTVIGSIVTGLLERASLWLRERQLQQAREDAAVAEAKHKSAMRGHAQKEKVAKNHREVVRKQAKVKSIEDRLKNLAEHAKEQAESGK